MKITQEIKQEVKKEVEKKLERLSYVDPLELEANLGVYLYNFAMKMLKKYVEE